jgi:hypothetical protein
MATVPQWATTAGPGAVVAAGVCCGDRDEGCAEQEDSYLEQLLDLDWGTYPVGVVMIGSAVQEL